MMMMRLSTKKIGFTLLIYYVIFWLTITYYFTSQEQTSENPAWSRHSYSPPTLTLTAHLYINGTHLPKEFPNAGKLKPENVDESTAISSFPVIDDYPEGDPYLPWIHDILPSKDRSHVIILAQNRRRCHTGTNHEHIMKQQEPQIALFQPISLTSSDNNGNEKEDGFHEPTSMKISNVEDAIIHETRFLCRFKKFEVKGNHLIFVQEETTYSVYPYNYEYISWRKRMNGMFETNGKDMAQFWLSSLEFHCPVPSSFASTSHGGGGIQVYLDIATIRSPVRGEGEWFLKEMGEGIFDVYKTWGRDLKVKGVQESTRWENIFIPFLNSPAQIMAPSKDGNRDKPYQLVACTWSSAAHNRRGDAVTLTDGKERLREWIAFNLLVGFDHVVVYDNSYANSKVATLQDVTDQFGSSKVTYVPWPCMICNNNRPAHDDPGERSSQYAAEASCRSRFGPLTDWMTFLDPDEYLVPMGEYHNWKDILNEIDSKEKRKVLKFRSTRARPRLNFMESTFDPSYQNCPTREEVALKKPGKSSCLVPKKNATFLQTYNCESYEASLVMNTCVCSFLIQINPTLNTS